MASAITPGGDRDGQVIMADAPLGTGHTPVVRLGDWMGWIALAGMVVFVVYDPVAKVRARGNSAAGESTG